MKVRRTIHALAMLSVFFISILASCTGGDNSDESRGAYFSPGEGDDDSAEHADDEGSGDDIDDDLNDDTVGGDDDLSGCSNKGEIFSVKWITIPEGSFMMGCSPGDENCKQEEYPLHPVKISSFQISESEITQFQFEEVMGYNPTNFDLCPNCPVDGVEFSVSVEFCELIGGQLPTEAQWEYVARAGTETKYYCGNDDSCLEDIAWYDSNSDGRPHEVCLKEANDFGIFDILGNLHEYTIDNCYEYPLEEELDPSHPEPGDWRVLRGAGWASPPVGLRVSYRHQTDPPPYDVDGIRCVKEIE